MVLPQSKSKAALLASLPPHDRSRFLESLTHDELQLLNSEWKFWARPNQLPPETSWRTWLVLAGRGFGKTRTGAEWVKSQVESGVARRIALVARTAADARDVMVEGESGLLAISSPSCKPIYEPSKRRLTWPNGAIATTFSAEEPSLLRGPQHDAAWCDELASWKYPEAWDMLMFGLRFGDPQVVVTTTPRPTKLLKELIGSKTTHITRGSTYDNQANLAPGFIEEILKKYEGTRLGRQELNAEMLEDVPGALWQRSQIDAGKVTVIPSLTRIVIAIDPAVTSGENSDETGILVVGKTKDDAFVLEDLSCRETPDRWARIAVNAFRRWKADRIVAEVNNGGDLVRQVLKTVEPNIPFTAVRASRGKASRAEPVSALYEQGRVHHVGSFPELEDQMCAFVPDHLDTSPDRVDALVWGISQLMFGIQPFDREIRRP